MQSASGEMKLTDGGNFSTSLNYDVARKDTKAKGERKLEIYILSAGRVNLRQK